MSLKETSTVDIFVSSFARVEDELDELEEDDEELELSDRLVPMSAFASRNCKQMFPLSQSYGMIEIW